MTKTNTLEIQTMDEYEKNKRRNRLQNKKHKDNSKRERRDRFKAEKDDDWLKEQEELIKIEEALEDEEWYEYRGVYEEDNDESDN